MILYWVPTAVEPAGKPYCHESADGSTWTLSHFAKRKVTENNSSPWEREEALYLRSISRRHHPLSTLDRRKQCTNRLYKKTENKLSTTTPIFFYSETQREVIFDVKGGIGRRNADAQGLAEQRRVSGGNHTQWSQTIQRRRGAAYYAATLFCCICG